MSKKIIALAKDRINAKGHHPAELLDAEKCIGCWLRHHVPGYGDYSRGVGLHIWLRRFNERK